MPEQLTGLTQAELSDFVQELGEPAYRGRQLFSAIQRRRVRSYDQITDLPKEFRAKLQERAEISTLKVESRYLSTDGTRRYRSEEHTSELQSQSNLVCRHLLEKKKITR